ncbi:MAG: hypothetical protein Fur0015_02540 [Ignavibacteriales bacterium]
MKFLILFLLAITILAQEVGPQFGGEFIFEINHSPELTENQRKTIISENIKVISELTSLGKISFSPQSANFSWPLQASKNYNGYSYYGISGFVDHDPNYPNQLKDYNNGTRTYDLESGYNHKGTDIFLWPFGWVMMENNFVEIISMADGIIIGKDDGNYDRNCGINFNTNWNAVYIRHDNGAVAWYGHMKKNSLTQKNVGERVSTGEYLGIVGSSGASTGPHLHLEVYDENYKLIDPWFGPGNTTITSYWWIEQKPYYDSKINKIATHSQWPVFPACPETEKTYEQNEFLPGDTICFLTYYQDQLKGQMTNYKIIQPNGVIWYQWNHSSTEDHYSASYWGWRWIFPANSQQGIWKFEVTYNGKVFQHYFKITRNPTDILENISVDNFVLYQNYPNPFGNRLSSNSTSTTIKYSLPRQNINAKKSEQSEIIQRNNEKDNFVTLKIFDVLGKEIALLVNKNQPPGNYEVKFNTSLLERQLTSGIYFYQLTVGDFRMTKKMIFLR